MQLVHYIMANKWKLDKEDSKYFIFIINRTIMIETLALLGLTCCCTVLIPKAYFFSVALFFENFF